MTFSSGAECVRAKGPTASSHWQGVRTTFGPKNAVRHELNDHFWFLQFPDKQGLTYSLQIQIIQQGADTWKEEMIDEMGYRRAFVHQTR